MNVQYAYALLLLFTAEACSVSFKSPLRSAPYQLTKGPGSYGKSAWDLRYRAVPVIKKRPARRIYCAQPQAATCKKESRRSIVIKTPTEIKDLA